MTSSPPPHRDGPPVDDAADAPVRRERQLAAFAHTAAVIAREPTLETVLDRLADEVRAATGMCTCAVVLTDEGAGEFRYAGRSGLPPDYVERLEAARRNGAYMVTTEAVRTRRPIVARGTRDRVLGDPRWAPAYDLLRDAPWDAFVALPMIVRGRAIGALNGFHRVGHVPDDAEVGFLAAMADHAAIAVDNARMYRELQLRAAEEERQRLARDMHDSVTQALFSLTLQARSIELTARERAERGLITELAELRELAQSALTEMRALIQHRRPAELHEQGLAQGLRRHAAAVAGAAGLSAEVVCDEDPLLEQNLEEDLFRLVQEALNNVVKHARARHVRIELRRGTEQGTLVVEVIDDGVGLGHTGGGAMHFGMTTMQDRARRHGGTLTVGAGPGGIGTMVRVVVPGALAPVAGTTG
ncbi:GAF domain-containing protein [Blastococcus sp. SYSU D00669]